MCRDIHRSTIGTQLYAACTGEHGLVHLLHFGQCTACVINKDASHLPAPIRGQQLSEEEKFQKSDNSLPRKEALIRLGTVGADQVATDDDVLLLIAPQNGTQDAPVYLLHFHALLSMKASLRNYLASLCSHRRDDSEPVGGYGESSRWPTAHPVESAAGRQAF